MPAFKVKLLPLSIVVSGPRSTVGEVLIVRFKVAMLSHPLDAVNVSV